MAKASVIKEFFASLGLDVDEASFKRGEAAISGISTVLKGAAYAFAGFAAAVGLSTSEFIHQTDKLRSWSRVTGASVEQLDAFRLAARGAGVDTLRLVYAAEKLSHQLYDVSKGRAKPAADALKDLGLKLEDISGLNAIDALEKIQIALAGVENDSKRTGLGATFFGERFNREVSGLDFEAFRKTRLEIEALGITLDDADVALGKELHTQLEITTRLIETLGFKMIKGLVPAFNDVVEASKRWYKANQTFIKQDIPKYFQAIGDAMAYTVKHAKFYLEGLIKLVGGFDNLVLIAKIAGGVLGVYLTAQVGGLIQAFYGVVTAIRAATFWMALLKAAMFAEILIIGVLAGVFALFVDELLVRLKGGETVIDDFFNSKKIKADDNVFILGLRALIIHVGILTHEFAALWAVITGGADARAAAVADLARLAGLIDTASFGTVEGQKRWTEYLAGQNPPSKQPTPGARPGAQYDKNLLQFFGIPTEEVPSGGRQTPVRSDLLFKNPEPGSGVFTGSAEAQRAQIAAGNPNLTPAEVRAQLGAGQFPNYSTGGGRQVVNTTISIPISVNTTSDDPGYVGREIGAQVRGQIYDAIVDAINSAAQTFQGGG